MALDLLAIISAAGTGAITGYLTNNLALKMIFKEYGPLGGVVIKTKDEFIDSISALVERDLVNHHTLEAEFSRPEFKESFQQSVDDFLNIYLEERSSELKFGEIPGWEDNFELLSSSAASSIVGLLAESSSNLKEEKLDNLVSTADQEQFLKEFFTIFIKKAEAAESIEKLISGFYEQFKAKSLAQFLNKESQAQFKELVKETVGYFRNNYHDLGAAAKEDFKEEIKALLDLEKLSQNILDEIKELRLSDLIKDKNQLDKIFADSELRDFLKEILVNFKIEAVNSELLLADFFSSELEADLKAELSELIYTAESDLMGFLETEESRLNNLIFESVEEEIEASTGFKAMSRQGIYSKYQENISEYGFPVEHLKDYLKEQMRSDDQKLSSLLMEKIKDLKINSLLSQIDLEAVSNLLENLIREFYQQHQDQKLIELFSEDIFAEQKLSDKIAELFFSVFDRLSSEEESIEILFDYLMEFKLESLFSQEKLTLSQDKIAAKIYELLSENKFIIEKGAEYLNQNFYKLLNQGLKNSEAEFEKGINNYIKKQQNILGEKEIKSLYSFFQNDRETVADLTESITGFFYNNLPELLEGKVAQAASSNLHQLSDQEVQAAIEDFMGKELKPITYLGALLGAAAGIIFSLSGAETAIFSSSPVWVNYLSSAFLYGVVGWLTNVLAIWMIFHPYQEKNILGIKLPFTPGVVAKNRKRFANSMGRFVEKELLKANSAAEIMENNRSEIKEQTLIYFEESDYQQLFKLLQEKNESLAEILIDNAKHFLKEIEPETIGELIGFLAEKIQVLMVNKAASIDFKAVFKNYAGSDENQFDKLERLISSQLEFDDLKAAAAGNYRFNLNSNQFKQLLQNKELYPLFKFLAPYLLEKEFEFDLKNYLLELLRDNQDYYLQQFLNFFFEQQDTAARLINFKKDEIIEKEKDKKGGLLKNTLISGAIYMADLDEFVESVVERVFNKLQAEYSVENREKLDKLYFKLLENIEQKELLTGENMKINQILKNFVSTEAGSELITEVLYLSDDSLSALIDLLLKEEKSDLLSLEFELKTELVDYLLKQLSLEQKLKLLLQLKKLFETDNIKKEVLQLLNSADTEILNQELELILNDLNLIDPEVFDAQIFADFKQNLLSLIESQELNELLLNKSAEEILDLSELLKEELNRDSLKYLLALFVEAGVDSFKANSETLLKSLELQELTAAEISKMNPAEIEQVFDSFAGKYFAQLKQYGWFGGVFGVLQLLLRTIT
ncbi:MAG: DUF445 family protein [Halanaerobium sp.]